MGLSIGKIGEAIGRRTWDIGGEVLDVGEGDVGSCELSFAMTGEVGESRSDGGDNGRILAPAQEFLRS